MRAEPYRSRMEEGWDLTWEFGCDPHNLRQIICIGESEWLWGHTIVYLLDVVKNEKQCLVESWIYIGTLQ